MNCIYQNKRSDRAGNSLRKGLAVSSAALALWFGSAAYAAAQDQDQGPPQYPQQDSQQAPPQNPQQDPQQAPQDSQGPPQYPDQGPSQYPQQGPSQYPQQGPSQYPPQGQPQYPPQGQPQYPQPGQQPGSQYPPNTSQQGPTVSQASVARVSFVQGGVQINSGGQAQFEQALMNMPLVQGSVLQTQEDGEAEVEFSDGSVARLTPNSSLQVIHLGQDGVQVAQLSGLSYYELNVGQGHPSYSVGFANASLVPTANSIFRVNLDNVPEVAVMSGTVDVTQSNAPPMVVADNQSLRLDGGGAVAQGVNSDSWDQWNQDRDQTISQEAEQQTSVRNQSGAANDENWNDLDSYGDWYSLPGSGNVWVPSGVDTSWDPYGYGYWGYYPTFGYVWVSGYPWGWLPYHCGGWSYYSFGWGWSPGGCGGWFGVGIVHGYPGYFMPARPIFRFQHNGPIISQRVIRVERGPNPRGPWEGGHPVRLADRGAGLNFNGRTIAPVNRVTYSRQPFTGFRGTTPGVRTVLNERAGFQGQQVVHTQQPNFNGQRVPQNQPQMQPNRFPTNTPQQTQVQPHQYQVQPHANNQVQPHVNTFNQGGGDPRTNYVQHYEPAPHYTAPPARYTPPPAPHYSAPPPAPHYSAPPPSSGGAHGHH